MHVALNGWFWDQPYTGSGQYLRGLVAGLAELCPDIRLTLVLPAHNRSPQDVPTGVAVAPAPTRLPRKLGKIWFEQRGFPATVGQIGADIAHVPYWGPPLSSPARLVVSVLDVIPLALREYHGGIGNQLYISLVRAAVVGAGHILTLSEASRSDIEAQLHIPAEKITVTYLAADERYMPIPPDPEHDEAVRAKYGLPDEFALYIGGFDRRKNVNTLLLAWTYVGQPLGEFVPLVLAGPPPTEWGTPLFPDLPAYSRELNVDKYLVWPGAIDEADKPALYRLAKLLIYPSLYEGFGLPPLEAMACGTPVVTGNVSAMPEVVGDAAYLVDPTDARAMGGAILAMLVQDDLHEHMRNLARGRATEFTWRKTAQQTREVYEKVIRES
ncbi:MAG: glycosyltransferase family 4 protein [Anaerolineales bacterium]